MRFYGEESLAPRPTAELEDHPLSAVRDCLFNIFAATLHIGCRSFIRNLRTRHAVVTRDPVVTKRVGSTVLEKRALKGRLSRAGCKLNILLTEQTVGHVLPTVHLDRTTL